MAPSPGSLTSTTPLRARSVDIDAFMINSTSTSNDFYPRKRRRTSAKLQKIEKERPGRPQTFGEEEKSFREQWHEARIKKLMTEKQTLEDENTSLQMRVNDFETDFEHMKNSLEIWQESYQNVDSLLVKTELEYKTEKAAWRVEEEKQSKAWERSLGIYKVKIQGAKDAEEKSSKEALEYKEELSRQKALTDQAIRLKEEAIEERNDAQARVRELQQEVDERKGHLAIITDVVLRNGIQQTGADPIPAHHPNALTGGPTSTSENQTLLPPRGPKSENFYHGSKYRGSHSYLPDIPRRDTYRPKSSSEADPVRRMSPLPPSNTSNSQSLVCLFFCLDLLLSHYTTDNIQGWDRSHRKYRTSSFLR